MFQYFKEWFLTDVNVRNEGMLLSSLRVVYNIFLLPWDEEVKRRIAGEEALKREEEKKRSQ